jgi:hypothetical protein
VECAAHSIVRRSYGVIMLTLPYTITPEHAHAALSEKDKYLTLSDANRCIRLAKVCNKAFDYYSTITPKAESDGIWVASLWIPNSHFICDALVAVDMYPPEGVTVESVRLELTNSMSGVVFCLSESRGAMVSVPYKGLSLQSVEH